MIWLLLPRACDGRARCVGGGSWRARVCWCDREAPRCRVGRGRQRGRDVCGSEQTPASRAPVGPDPRSTLVKARAFRIELPRSALGHHGFEILRTTHTAQSQFVHANENSAKRNFRIALRDREDIVTFYCPHNFYYYYCVTANRNNNHLIKLLSPMPNIQ